MQNYFRGSSIGERLGSAALRVNTRVLLTSSCLLRNPRKSLIASNKSFFQQPLSEPCISVLDGLLHTLFTCTMQWDTLHNFYHSLSVAKVSISLSSKILRKVRRVYQFLNVVMIPWLNYCRSEVVMLTDTDIRYSDGREKRPADALEHY